MNTTLLKLTPLLLFLFGFFVLFMTDFAIIAGIFLLLAVIMIIEQIWPEKWELEK